MYKVNIAARAEYYHDKNGVIISTGTLNGFKTWGYSTNVDYKIADHFLWRVEAKNYHSADKIFMDENAISKNNTSVSTSLQVSF